MRDTGSNIQEIHYTQPKYVGETGKTGTHCKQGKVTKIVCPGSVEFIPTPSWHLHSTKLYTNKAFVPDRL